MNSNIRTADEKEEMYRTLLSQVKCMISGENNIIANLANTAALIKSATGFFWVGWYFVSGNDSLVLGPFQGPVACTRIKKGKGVCGTSWNENRAIIVPDVEKFDGHIACSSESKSEIVIPVLSPSNNTEVVAVLDIDSDSMNSFDEIDLTWLKGIVQLCSGMWK